MTYQEIHKAATSEVGPFCKNCPVCNGRACGNTMPGPGCKYPGNVAARNFDKWQEICVNMDTLNPNVEPDVGFDFGGRRGEDRIAVGQGVGRADRAGIAVVGDLRHLAHHGFVELRVRHHEPDRRIPAGRRRRRDRALEVFVRTLPVARLLAVRARDDLGRVDDPA